MVFVCLFWFVKAGVQLWGAALLDHQISQRISGQTTNLGLPKYTHAMPELIQGCTSRRLPYRNPTYTCRGVLAVCMAFIPGLARAVAVGAVLDTHTACLLALPPAIILSNRRTRAVSVLSDSDSQPCLSICVPRRTTQYWRQGSSSARSLSKKPRRCGMERTDAKTDIKDLD
jgi:hypothetical protein